MRLLKITLNTLLILFPLGEVIRFNLGSNIFVKPLDVLAGLLLIVAVIAYVSNKRLRVHLKWYYFYFPIVGFVSLCINTFWLKPHEFFVSFLYLLRWVSYMSIFFAVIATETEFRKKITNILFIDGFVLIIIGFIQYFLYPSLRNLYYLGWDEHLYRMFSTFLDPNFFGAFLVLYSLFVTGLAFNVAGRLSVKNKLIYFFIIITSQLAILLTYSRSALLMLIASGVTFFLFIQRKRFILYLIMIIVLFTILISPYFYIENIDLLRINSSLARLTTTQHALKIIQDHSLIGVGFDSYRYAQIQYHFINSESQFPAHSAAGVDISLLFVLATAGIIGLIAYSYLWFRLLVTAKARSNRFFVIFLASGIGLFINAFFINSLFYSEIMLWMWVIAGLAVANE